ncbi:MAG: glycosyltransferase family 4 protein [bacterium]
MRLIFLTHQYPYPLFHAGVIATYNLIKQLCAHAHEIILVAISDQPHAIPDGGDDLAEHVAHLERLRRPCLTTASGALTNLFASKPYTLSKYHFRHDENLLADLVERHHPDLVYCDHLHTAHHGVLLKNRCKLPILLHQHNVESTIMNRLAHEHRNPAVRLFAKIQYRKLIRYESRIIGEFDRVIALTDKDKQAFEQMNAGARVVAIPHGIDLAYFLPGPESEEERAILTAGSLHWLPNQEGARWFLDEVFPRIIAQEPRAKFYLVGNAPPKDLVARASERIIVTGLVDDVRPYHDRAQVFVVPLHIGSGMRMKILNAFAMEKAVVSTPVGAEGLTCRDGEHILIAQDPGAFADAVVKLIRTPELRQRLGKNGRELVEREYSWGGVTRRICDVLDEVVRDSGEKATTSG